MDDYVGTGFCHRIKEETRDASPANLVVKIVSLSLLSKYKIDKYESKEFQSGGHKWKVTIYYDDDGSISVYFSIADPHLLPVGWEVHTSLAFFIYNHRKKNYTCFRETTCCCFNADYPQWGILKVISRKRLENATKGYVVRDYCEFGAEVVVGTSERIHESMILVQHSTLATQQWKIHNFSKIDDVWCSKEFNVGDYIWKVKLYPKGVPQVRKDRYVSVFLKSKDLPPHHRVKVLVEFRIKNKYCGATFSDTCSHWYTTSCVKSGFKKFISLADMMPLSKGCLPDMMCLPKGFLADDCCILEVDITVQAIVRDAHNNHGASSSV